MINNSVHLHDRHGKEKRKHGERTVIEAPVLLHQYDDVLDPSRKRRQDPLSGFIISSRGGFRREDEEGDKCLQSSPHWPHFEDRRFPKTEGRG